MSALNIYSTEEPLADDMATMDNLEWAVELGYIATVRRYVADKKIRKLITPARAAKLLRRAVMNKDQNMVAMLLHLKPPLDLQTKSRLLSPLWTAVVYTHSQIIKMLVRAGANLEKPFGPNGVHDVECRVLHYLISIWNPHINPIREELVDLLLEYGADVNSKDSRGCTPLHYAVNLNDVNIATKLIARGAGINIKDKKGETPLLTACKSYAKEEIVVMLIRNGADVYARTNEGFNALHLLAKSNTESPDAAEVLLKRRVPLYEADYNKYYTPLHYAVKTGKETLTKMLLEYEAEEHARHGDHFNPEFLPLLLAVAGKSALIVEMLITKGANIEEKTRRGRTPLHIACYNKRDRIISVLLEYGANINALDSSGETPFSLIEYKNLSSSIQTMIRMIAKLKSLNKPVNEIDFRTIKEYPLLQTFYEDCLKELNEMKQLKLMENVSYYSIFSKNLVEMALLIKDGRLILPLKLKKIRRLFPIYGSEFNRALSKAELLYVDLDHIEQRLNAVFCGSVPDTIIREIMISLLPPYFHV